MKQEDKDLLLKDLCGRLTYGVYFIGYKIVFGGTDIAIFDKEKMMGIIEDNLISQSGSFNISRIKHYLRPMSSMTEEEREEYLHINLCDVIDCKSWNEVDCLNAHHFDYRSLIEKGLAAEAPEGMYN